MAERGERRTPGGPGRPASDAIREGGFSLVETVVALALLGLALLLPLSLLVHDARWAMAEPAAVEAEALLEAVVEEIRAGARPLTDQTLAPVDLPWPAAHAQGMRVTVGVTAEPTPNLWRLDLVTRYRAGGRARERRLVTLVWRP